MNSFTDLFTSLSSLYGAFRLAHWNVEGANFYAAHLLFQRVYGMLGAQIDPLAEQLRGMEIEISSEFLNQTPEVDWVTCSELTQALSSLVSAYEVKLKHARMDAQARENIGLVAQLETMLSEANTIQYLLKSSLKD